MAEPPKAALDLSSLPVTMADIQAAAVFGETFNRCLLVGGVIPDAFP